MTGLLLLATFIGIAYVVYWTIANDGVDEAARQGGWLQMRVPATEAESGPSRGNGGSGGRPRGSRSNS